MSPYLSKCRHEFCFMSPYLSQCSHWFYFMSPYLSQCSHWFLFHVTLSVTMLSLVFISCHLICHNALIGFYFMWPYLPQCSYRFRGWRHGVYVARLRVCRSAVRSDVSTWHRAPTTLLWQTHYNHACSYIPHDSCLSQGTWDMMTSSNGRFFRVTGPLCGEFTGHRWISLIKGQYCGLWYFFDVG